MSGWSGIEGQSKTVTESYKFLETVIREAEVGKQRKSARAKSTRVCLESAVAAHKARFEQAQSARVRPKLTDS